MIAMEPDQAQKIAIMAGAAAVLAALAKGRLPRWLRITLVSSLAALACAAGLLGYPRQYPRQRAVRRQSGPVRARRGDACHVDRISERRGGAEAGRACARAVAARGRSPHR